MICITKFEEKECMSMSHSHCKVCHRVSIAKVKLHSEGTCEDCMSKRENDNNIIDRGLLAV